MKHNLSIIMIIFLSHIYLGAQEQIFPDPDLKVVKKNGEITVSFPDGRHSMSFPGDTVYRLESDGFMVVVHKGKLGIIDPWDLYWIIEPTYENIIASFTEETALVKKNGKYSIVIPYDDGFDQPYMKFDTMYPLTPAGEEVYNGMHMYVLKNKGKYGLYTAWSGPEEFLPIKFDEIKLLASHSDGIVYKMRKGKKWGAGDCETYETKIAYDDIHWLTGSCANNYFRIEKKDHYGLVATYSYGDYVYPPMYDMISFAGEYIGNGYFILKKGDKYDVVDDTFPPFQPRYDNVHIMETEGLTRISMEADGKISTLEIEY